MKSDKITAMRAGGRILAQILAELKTYTKPGMNELDIDKWVADKILAAGAEIAYHERSVNFPGAICISVNDELIHGAPEDNILQDGDKVSYDLTIKYQGYYTDSAFTMIVGQAKNPALKHLISCNENAMMAGIAAVRAGVKLGDVGYAIEQVLEQGKLGIIRNYVGHGIGNKMHMSPDVPNYGRRGHGEKLRAGDTICIEPMSSLGKPDNYITADGWTISLKDGSIGAHCEHTILVTEDGCEILTQV